MRQLAKLAVAAAALLCSAHSQAIPVFTSDLVAVTEIVAGSDWTFSVGGWDGGGVVTGSFSGTDGDGDMQLSSFSGEVTGFSASYSGGAIVGPVAFGLADLFGLVYDLDGGPLGDGLALAIEGIGAVSGIATFLIGPGPLGLCGVGTPCGLIDGPAAGPVSEPPVLMLALSGWALVAGIRRRRT